VIGFVNRDIEMMVVCSSSQRLMSKYCCTSHSKVQ